MYARPNNMYRAYQQNDILTLSPVAIIERLYQAMERSLIAAKDAMEKGQPAIKGEKLGHALAIIGELQASLDMEKGGEIATNLYDLYSFATHRLLMANMKDDTAIIDEVLRTMQPLSEAWTTLRMENRGQETGSGIESNREINGNHTEPVRVAAGY
jgi:flagellar protein FliS